MSCCDHRVLVTGATGLIGRELANPLKRAGFEVHAVSRDIPVSAQGFVWHRGSLFDEDFIRRVIREVRPSHLLNLAWCTTGDYLTSDLNARFLAAGEALARHFVAAGGCCAVYAGTCFEYKLGKVPLSENDELDALKNPYVRCKDELRRRATGIFSRAGVSFAYGRIFYVFGRGEPNSRLTGMVLEKLLREERVTIKAGPLAKDYIYAKDVAASFVALLRAPVEGPVNVCTGRAITIRDFVMTIARRIGRVDLVAFEDDCANQPPVIVGDNTRLTDEVGYRPQWTIDQAVADLLCPRN